MRAALSISAFVLAWCIALPPDLAAQVTDVKTVPGDGAIVVTFSPSAGAVSHDLYLATETGVTAGNFDTLEGGRAILGVGPTVTVRGLETNREYFIVVVELDGEGGMVGAPEVRAAPRGAFSLVDGSAAFLGIASDPLVAGEFLAVGNAPGGCAVSPKPAGCDVFRSSDGGITFAITTAGLPEFDPRAVVIRDSVAFVASKNLGAGDTIFKSTDSGQNFSSSITGANVSAAPKSFAIDPSQPETIFAGSFDFGRGANSQIVRTIDGGQNWNHLTELIPPMVLNSQAIAVNPSTPLVVWLGGPGNMGVPLARSTNGGLAWNPITVEGLTAVSDIVFDALVPTKMWIAGPSAVYRSVNGGSTFDPRSDGIRPGAVVTAMARDSEQEVLWVGTTMGVYESRDDGLSFGLVAPAFSERIDGLAITSEPAALVVATSSGIFRLDLAVAEITEPETDAGPETGDDDGGGGCGCQGAQDGQSAPGFPGGAAIILMCLGLLAVRGRASRVSRRSERRSRG